jgi:hypothetical protein
LVTGSLLQLREVFATRHSLGQLGSGQNLEQGVEEGSAKLGDVVRQIERIHQEVVPRFPVGSRGQGDLDDPVCFPK